MNTEVVLASRNDGKLAEMQALFGPLGWKLRSVAEFCDDAAEETAPSFVENALLKARHAALVSGLPAIADDSGLEVAALDGAPGVRSARYAGEDASDSDNNQKLLAALKNIPDERRGARFVCLMVYLRHAEDATPLITQGNWRGTILHNPRGTHGFGYDPLFLVPDLKRSAAELDAEVKNRVSHRGKAARHLYSMIHDAAA
ncbi:MAG: RdgB/HAM1 family non-canonical purine NTP pyrophosphatase [Nevskia sp.]|nr:RdgB/HAM1 family non-canonical purine NTP pyrophosphatase [Nevskia sp.]